MALAPAGLLASLSLPAKCSFEWVQDKEHRTEAVDVELYRC